MPARLLVALIVLLHLAVSPAAWQPRAECDEPAVACGVTDCCESCGESCPCAAPNRAPAEPRAVQAAPRGPIDPIVPWPARPAYMMVLHASRPPALAPPPAKGDPPPLSRRLAALCVRVV